MTYLIKIIIIINNLFSVILFLLTTCLVKIRSLIQEFVWFLLHDVGWLKVELLVDYKSHGSKCLRCFLELLIVICTIGCLRVGTVQSKVLPSL